MPDDRITGYIEAKAPTEERLDVVETSEQLQRYRETFPNLILTNFFEFRLCRQGERVDQVLAARPFVLRTLDAPPRLKRGRSCWKCSASSSPSAAQHGRAEVPPS